MNKKVLLVLAAAAVLALGAYFCLRSNAERNKFSDEAEIRSLVENFGQALKNVFLLSDTAAQDMEDNYKDFLDPVLLAQWKEDPSKAAGRLTSSSWPDSIEIADIRQFGSGAYDVSGKIIDMRSVDSMAGSRSIQIGVVKFGDRWIITGVSILPAEQNEPWKEYSGENGISFQYPEKLTAQYVFTQEWPPTIEVESGKYSCVETPQEVSSLIEIVSQRVIGERIYCVSVKHEGAAGSVYSSYHYLTPKQGKLLSISFVLRYPSCGNYNDAENQLCTAERETFDLDAIVDLIAVGIRLDISGDGSLASQLFSCAMSDSVSREKCEAVLEQIVDFDSCLAAGFSIMKSNPPQCRTLDGRIFVQNQD